MNDQNFDPQATETEAVAAEAQSEINLPDNLSFEELEQIKEAAIARQREQRGKERGADLNTIKVLMAKHDLKYSDVKPEKPVSTAVPKYRNIADPSQTWSGRGKAPAWLRDVADRDAYLIG